MAGVLFLLVVRTSLRMLCQSRLVGLIRGAAWQGVALGCFALLVRWEAHAPGMLLSGVLMLVLKGGVFPWFLLYVARQVHLARELQPTVGYIPSLLIGLAALAGAIRLARHLPMLPTPASHLLVPAALFCVFTGLFLMIGRRMALTQVVGFLVLENGIFLMGLALPHEAHFLVEIGVLLDMFVAVLIWTVLIRAMNRVFHHIDTHELQRLKG